jgi:hypothetical protein
MPALSDRSVAATTGLSPKTVAAVRARASEEFPQMHGRQGRDGRLRPLDSSRGRLRAAEMIRENPGASLREIAASAGISPGTARSVQAQLRAADESAVNSPQRSGPTGKQPVGKAAKSSAAAGADSASSRDGKAAEEINSILEKLSRDPALRHSDMGRRILQLIRAKAMDNSEQAAPIQESPQHSKPLLARLARHNVSIWKK